MSDDLKDEALVAEILPKRTQISLFAIFVFSFGLSVYLVLMVLAFGLEIVNNGVTSLDGNSIMLWPLEVSLDTHAIFLLPLFVVLSIHREYGKVLTDDKMSCLVNKSFFIGVGYYVLLFPLSVFLGVLLTGPNELAIFAIMFKFIFLLIFFWIIPLIPMAISLFTFLIYWNLARVFMSFNNKQM